MLTRQQFDDFVITQPLGNFIQSSARGLRRQTDGYTMHLVGVRRAGNVVAAAELDSRRLIGSYSDFMCLQGPILDYGDQNLLTFFLRELKTYTASQGGVKLTINPPVVLRLYDSHAILTDAPESSQASVRRLREAGFRHLDNQKIDQKKDWYRWFFVKDLQNIKDADSLMASFDGKTRNMVRKADKLGVTVREISLDELDAFQAIMHQAEVRREITTRSNDYYSAMKQSFGDNIKLMIAELDKATAISRVKSEIKTAKKEISQLNADPDAHAALRDRQTKLQQQNQLLETLASIRDDRIVLAGAVFIRYGRELTYLLSSLNYEYNWANGQYAIQWYMLNWALEHGVERYNFYGTGGKFSRQPDQHGVYVFKRGFGGVIEEQVGFFEIILNRKVHGLRQLKGALKRPG